MDTMTQASLHEFLQAPEPTGHIACLSYLALGVVRLPASLLYVPLRSVLDSAASTRMRSDICSVIGLGGALGRPRGRSKYSSDCK